MQLHPPGCDQTRTQASMLLSEPRSGPAWG